jgi:hypothetical protein
MGASAPRPGADDDAPLAAGVLLSFAAFTYCLIQYWTEIFPRDSSLDVRTLQSAATGDIGDWFMKELLLAYLEPGTDFIRKALFTAPAPGLVSLAVGFGMIVLFAKTGWLKYEEGSRFWVALGVNTAALYYLFGSRGLWNFVIEGRLF